MNYQTMGKTTYVQQQQPISFTKPLVLHRTTYNLIQEHSPWLHKVQIHAQISNFHYTKLSSTFFSTFFPLVCSVWFKKRLNF